MAQGKAHVPTPETRAIVRALAGYGIRREDIAKHPEIRVSPNTLLKHYQEDLDEGNSLALQQIGEAMFQKAIKGDTTALIFLSKTRIGLKEVSRIEQTGEDGGPIKIEETPRADVERRLARLRVVGGTEADS